MRFEEGEQQKTGHNGIRKKFSIYISLLWVEQNLLYDFNDGSNPTNTINHLENLKLHLSKKKLEKNSTCMGITA
jgi:hypothetical protein